VQFTDVEVPSVKLVPEAGLHVSEVMASGVAAVGVYVTIAEGLPIVGDTSIPEEQFMTGWEPTNTLKVQLEVRAALSVATQLTVVVPLGNMPVKDLLHTIPWMPLASVALMVGEMSAPLEFVGIVVTLEGHEMTLETKRTK
jgi:hypothetical protein